MILNSLRDAWALLIPIDCAGCGADDRGLCDSCRAALRVVVVPRLTPGGLTVHTALRYEAEARRVLLAFKEDGRTDVARWLAGPLTEAIAASRAATPGAVIVPVPTSPAAYRYRGFDPVRLLLRKGGVPHLRALTTVRRHREQKQLGLEDRAENLRGAVAATRSLTGRTVILVDDILTSGATLDEAARAVTAAGGTVAGGATVAFTPRLMRIRDIGEPEDYGGAKGVG